MPWKNLGKLAVILAVVYLTFRFLLPWLFPFVAAVLVVQLLRRWTICGERHLHLKRPAAVALLGSIVLGTVILAGGRLFLFLGRSGQRFLLFCQGSYPGWERQWWSFLGRCESVLGLPEGLFQAALAERLEGVIAQLASHFAEWAPAQLLRAVTGSMGFFVIMAVTLMASLLLYKDYDNILAELQRQSWYPSASRVYRRVSASGLTWIKTQGIILGSVSLICTLGLMLLGYQESLFLGILIGIVDFFPILGAGTVLVPWTLVCLLQGDWLAAAGTGGIYLLCFFLRQFLEPRLMGRQSGIRPFYMLLCIYLGLRLFGIWGVFLGPLGAALVRGMWEEWNSSQKMT